MQGVINWETITPTEAFKVSDKEIRQKILDMNILKFKKADTGQVEIVIPSMLCTINKNDKLKKDYFPFCHQVFWFLLQDLKDIKFALSDLKMIIDGSCQYNFPNGALVELHK